MSKRDQILQEAAYAGYHEDGKTLVRLICENRVSRQRMEEAFRAGRQRKKDGMKCGCWECLKGDDK